MSAVEVEDKSNGVDSSKLEQGERSDQSDQTVSAKQKLARRTLENIQVIEHWKLYDPVTDTTKRTLRVFGDTVVSKTAGPEVAFLPKPLNGVSMNRQP